MNKARITTLLLLISLALIWQAMFAKLDMPTSSALTQQKLNWKPKASCLIEDLNGMDYSKA
jgi:hypothetical protein